MAILGVSYVLRIPRLLLKALLCFDRLSMNGRNYNDFRMTTVRPEPVEGGFLFLHEAPLFLVLSFFAAAIEHIYRPLDIVLQQQHGQAVAPQDIPGLLPGAGGQKHKAIRQDPGHLLPAVVAAAGLGEIPGPEQAGQAVFPWAIDQGLDGLTEVEIARELKSLERPDTARPGAGFGDRLEARDFGARTKASGMSRSRKFAADLRQPDRFTV
jgi:hypothetical protein